MAHAPSTENSTENSTIIPHTYLVVLVVLVVIVAIVVIFIHIILSYFQTV